MDAFLSKIIRRIVLRYEAVDEILEVYVIPFTILNSHSKRDRPTFITKEWKQINQETCYAPYFVTFQKTTCCFLIFFAFVFISFLTI